MTTCNGFQALVDELLRSQGPSVGLGAGGNVQVAKSIPGCNIDLSIDSPAVCDDRFQLIIPYGGKSVKCEVVFFGNSVERPPDFLFVGKSSFSPNLEEIEAIANWHPNNMPADALLKLISQLMGSYRRHQAMLLMEKYPDLYEQYDLFIKHPEFTKENIEVNVLDEKGKGFANFLVNLPVSYSNIPPVHMKGNPGEDSAVLLVCFSSSQNCDATVQLILSPRIEKILNDTGHLRFTAYRTGDLVKYALDVSKMLQKKVDEIINVFAKKKEYFSLFLSYFANFLLEYDSDKLSYLAFLFEWKSFFFILKIEISEEFPKKCPVFVFQSTFSCSYRQSPFTVQCKHYPYNRTWTGYKMAKEARAYILDYIPSFHKQYIQNL